MNNHQSRWIQWVVGLLTTLVLGSYGYTSYTRAQIENGLRTDLNRIEGKVDEINRHLRSK